MGIGSFISGCISSVGSFISGCVGKVGSTVGALAKGALGVIGMIPGIGSTIINIAQVIGLAAKVIHGIAEILGIKSEEDPEVLGAKAEQAEKTIDHFDGDAEAYIRYLKEEVKLDKEKFDQMTPEEKLGCKVIGLSLETKAIEKKLGGIEIPPESLATLGKIYMSGEVELDAKELLEIVKDLKAAGITNMNDVVEYLEGKGNSDRIQTGKVLKEVIGENADDKINHLKDVVRSYEEK
jgi:hypothetical protein